jgi:predicted ATP-grasp superfamily ATP-dependent carboligase
MSGERSPVAVVIGMDSATGVQTARILKGHGVPVVGIAKDPDHWCCRTNACERILFTDIASDDLVETLETLGPSLGGRAVLIPCTDLSVLVVSRNRDRLAEHYHVMLSDPDVVEMLVDKVSFYTWAAEQELPIPTTFFLHSRFEAETAATKLEYPCMLRPSIRTPAWAANSKDKVIKIQSPEHLLQVYDRVSGWVEMLMVQDWVEGSDETLWSCNCYFDRSSEPLVSFVARKIRQWPPATGTACISVEERNDVVLETTLDLFRRVGYRGLGYVEMKQDSRTGKHFIIEPNIGRPTGRSAISEAGGVELIYTMYCDVIGRPLPPNRTQTYRGVKWISLRRDVQSSLWYARRGQLTFGDWWRSVRGRKAFAVWSWRDPAPFFADLKRSFGLLLKGSAGAVEEEAPVEEGQPVP